MALSDTELFDEVIDELIEVMLEGIEDDEDFQNTVIAFTDESKDFADEGDRRRCNGHWVRLYKDAVAKIKRVCRKAGL